MIVHNLHLISVSFAPAKTDSPLFVDANAVLPSAISRKLLQMIARGNSKIVEYLRGVQQCKLALCGPYEVGGKTRRELALKDFLSLAGTKALDHA